MLEGVKKYGWIVPLFFFIMQVLGSSCTKDVAEPRVDPQDTTDTSSSKSACDTLFNSFSQDVKAIFTQNCATSGCHDQGGQAGGIVLETHAQIKGETKNGKVLCAIRHESGCTDMPYQGSKLSQKKIKAIECWVKADYPNN